MSHIRVIGGSARGRRLKLVPGDVTRPIMDRVKENLFNILGSRVIGARVLDMFAGTGSVGIEALSRGAEAVRFLDTSRPAVQTIRENLGIAGFADRAEVRQSDAFGMLAQTPDAQFDLVYVAPPQYQSLWSRALLNLDSQPGWLARHAWVIAQIDPVEEESPALGILKNIDRRRYGNTLLLFYALE
jgi:16S rRNA (guanine(966)-N(2))-methyltransferase RsmD